MITPAASNFCPYKGLQPYTEADRAYFFGRERDQEIIASNLYAAPLTVLYGSSGVGKSSVIMAGVVPQLRQAPRLAVIVFRTWQNANFLQIIKDQTLQAVRQSAGKPISVDTALPFDEFCQQCSAALRGDLFFIFDQFEEYFAYHAPTTDETGFDVEFARAVNRREVAANFLLSMREDGLSRLDRFKGRIPSLLANMLRLEHLDRESAMSAIRNPLVEFNRNLDPSRLPLQIEDALVLQVIEQVRTGNVSLRTGSGTDLPAPVSSEDDRIETPYLQLVLTRLWDEEQRSGSKTLRLATLRKLGGAQQIVRTHLDMTMARLAESERGVAARAFRFMVTPSQTKIAYTVADLADFASVPVRQLEPVMKKLSAPDVRVLRAVAPPSGAAQEPRYEIFHDVLAPAVLDWRERYIESRRTRRLKLVGVSIAAVFVLFLAASLIAQWLTISQAARQVEAVATQVQATAAVGQSALQSQVSQVQLSLQQQSATQTAYAQTVVRGAATQDAQAQQAVKTQAAQAAQVVGLSQALLTPEVRPVGKTPEPTTVAVRATAAAAGTSQAQLLDFKVTSVNVAVRPDSSDACPTTFNAVAMISTNLTGTVTYRWELSDGTAPSQGSINMIGANIQSISATWSLAHPTVGTVLLRIITPNSFASNQASFVLRPTIYPSWLGNKIDKNAAGRGLDCPKGPDLTTAAVTQQFQNGMMYWRSDTHIIYVLYNDSTWQSAPDTWSDPQPLSANLIPPARLIEPVRGFGKVWRDILNGPSSKIGWATDIEQTHTLQVQEFENGLVMRDEKGKIVILLQNGKWAQVNEIITP